MRRAEKPVEIATFSLGILNIYICLRPHYIKRTGDTSLMIIKIALNFKAVQNFLQRSRKFDKVRNSFYCSSTEFYFCVQNANNPHDYS